LDSEVDWRFAGSGPRTEKISGAGASPHQLVRVHFWRHIRQPPGVAVHNGYANAGCTRLEFPSLPAIGRKIAQRKKTEMNRKGEILKAALEGDPPLTAEQMAGRLGFGCPGVLRRNFPAQYQALLEK
jgi:hypothetical protein